MAPKRAKAKAESKATEVKKTQKKTPKAKAKSKGPTVVVSTIPKVPVDPSKALEELLEGLREPGWKEALGPEFGKEYFADIARFVQEERSKVIVHPPADQVFSAFNETPFDKVRVVILGQDPYHEPGQAHGMCFSVPDGIKIPPSLANIYKELEQDVTGFTTPNHGYLMRWAQQGVLLLNATLTVREGHDQANSHSQCGWQRFTDHVISTLNDQREGVVFLLWGNFAQKKGKVLDQKRHKILKAGHPSPLSVRFWRGCKIFSKCNQALREFGKEEIDWNLPLTLGEDEEA